jgi:hypothetical protein
MEKQPLKAIGNLEKKVVDLYSKVKAGVGQTGQTGAPGPIGPQGNPGIDGAPGPVGPAGLTWRSTWSAGTAYLKDDAVGYNGASYFRLISGTTAGLPNVDTTNWALLASQGAVGPAGATGPIGSQGPAGIAPVLTRGDVTAGAMWSVVLPYDINIVTTSSTNKYVSLPSTALSVGKVVIVYAKANTYDFKVDGNGIFFSVLGIDQYASAITVKPNTNYRFIYDGFTWKVEVIEGVSSLLTSGAISATTLFPALPYDINFATTDNYNKGFTLPITTVLGKEIIVYVNSLFQDRVVTIKADLINSLKISFQGYSSQTSQINIRSNENWKFTHLGDGNWRAEAIGASLGQILMVNNSVSDGYTTLYIGENFLALENTDGNNTQITPAGLTLTKNNLSSTNFQAAAVTTAQRLITLPDADGVVALQTYKIYTALLEFVNGTTIITTVLENTIGNGSGDGINDIAWSYNSATQVKAVMTNAPFTDLKTLCSSSIYDVNMNLQGVRMTSQQCRFYSSNINTRAASLSFVPYVLVEIKVYN